MYLGVGMDAESQLRLLERRHMETLRFIDASGQRILYDEWMGHRGFASEFTSGTYQP